MTLSKKNIKHLIGFLFLGVCIGTISWFIIEAIVRLFYPAFSLSTGKIGFDLQVLSIYLNLNVGTLYGLLIGYIIFKKI